MPTLGMLDELQKAMLDPECKGNPLEMDAGVRLFVRRFFFLKPPVSHLSGFLDTSETSEKISSITRTPLGDSRATQTAVTAFTFKGADPKTAHQERARTQESDEPPRWGSLQRADPKNRGSRRKGADPWMNKKGADPTTRQTAILLSTHKGRRHQNRASETEM